MFRLFLLVVMLCLPVTAQAGPIARLFAWRLDRRASGELPRQRVFSARLDRRAAGELPRQRLLFGGGSCSNGSCR